MGFLHQTAAPPAQDEIAHRVDRLSDAEVADAAAFGLAYERLRGAFLAMSGVSMLRSLRLVDAGDVAGLLATTRSALAQARDHLASGARTTSPRVRPRMERAAAAIEQLDAEALRVWADLHLEVRTDVLELVRSVLATVSAPRAGISHVTSVSCAGYYSFADGTSHHHGHGHDHHGGPDHHHHHHHH